MHASTAVKDVLVPFLVALAVNVAAHAALDVWSSYVVAVLASVLVAGGVWVGLRMRRMRAGSATSDEQPRP